jgi:acyl-CoA thioesterase FadM
MPLFSRTITTRGYEPDRHATVPIQRYLNYLEWLRWEFIQDPETGLVEGLAGGHFPVVRSQRFELVQRVGMGRELVLWARVTKVGRSTVTLEHHVVAADDGSLVAHALVEGLWLGPSRRLVRIPDAFRSLAAEHANQGSPPHEVLSPRSLTGDGPLIHTNPQPHVFERRGIDLDLEKGSDEVFRMERVVRPSDIDIFSHVNAATYVDIFEDVLYEAYKAQTVLSAVENRPQASNRLVIQYDREALLDEVLAIDCWPVGNGGYAFELCRASDREVLCRATLFPGV